MSLIHIQSINPSSATVISFTNIPQTYTDLMVVMNLAISNNGQQHSLVRLLMNNPQGQSYEYYHFNSISTVNSAAITTPSSNFNNIQYLEFNASVGSSNGSQSFSSVNFYMPSYSGSGYKTFLNFGGAIGESSGQFRVGSSVLTNKLTSPLTSFEMSDAVGGTFRNSSLVSIYGIK